MSTRGELLDDVIEMLGDRSDTFRDFMVRRFNSVLRRFWNLHDWEFKHKIGTFNTAVGTELYDLNSASVVGSANRNVRSANDIEFMYNKTKGVPVRKVNLADIRRSDTTEVASGTARWYAPWGQWNIYLKDKPNSIDIIKFLYSSTPLVPTEGDNILVEGEVGYDSDDNDMLTTYGLPYHMEPYFEKYLLAEGMLKVDESRRESLLLEIQKIWKPEAIQVDMEHLESCARFRFWSEVMGNNGTFDDYLRSAFYQDVYAEI